MKTIQFENGGFPILADFFVHMQEGLGDAITGLASRFGPYAIISGCSTSISSPTSSVGEGYVVFNKEVCYVPAHNFSYTPGQTIVAYKVIDAIACPKNYADGNTYDLATSVTVKFKAVNTLGMGDVAATVFTNFNTTWTLMTPNLVNSWGAGDSTKFGLPSYRREGRYVYMRGSIAAIGTPAVPVVNQRFFTLPEQFRPAQNMIFPAISTPNVVDGYLVTPELCWIRIMTNGECFSTLNAPGAVILNSVRFDTL